MRFVTIASATVLALGLATAVQAQTTPGCTTNASGEGGGAHNSLAAGEGGGAHNQLAAGEGGGAHNSLAAGEGGGAHNQLAAGEGGGAHNSLAAGAKAAVRAQLAGGRRGRRCPQPAGERCRDPLQVIASEPARRVRAGDGSRNWGRPVRSTGRPFSSGNLRQGPHPCIRRSSASCP